MSRWIDLIKLNEANGFEVTGITFAAKVGVATAVQTNAAIMSHPSPPNPVSSIGSYIVKCGKKYMDQRLDQIDMYDLDNYVKYLIKSASETGKPLKGDFLEFVQTAEQFLEGKTIKRSQRR